MMMSPSWFRGMDELAGALLVKTTSMASNTTTRRRSDAYAEVAAVKNENQARAPLHLLVSNARVQHPRLSDRGGGEPRFVWNHPKKGPAIMMTKFLLVYLDERLTTNAVFDNNDG
jgi:hypothetical protein